MPHHDERMQTGDGLTLDVNCWMPEGEVRAVVVFVHGFTEHSGRYGALAEALERQGYATWAMDLRGHGKSEGRPVYVRSFDQYLDDLDRLLARVREVCPHKPLYLIGHSMGGAIVLLAALERQPQAAGIVTSAPPVKVGGAVFPLLRHLAWVVSRTFPRLRLLAMGCSMLSRDPEVVEDFRNDPLVFHGRFPVRTGSEILRASRRIRRRMAELRLPLLALHGTGDVVCNAEGSRRLYAEAASADKTLKQYDGLYHDIFHEPEKDSVIADVLHWLGRQAERPTADASAETS